MVLSLPLPQLSLTLPASKVLHRAWLMVRVLVPVRLKVRSRVRVRVQVRGRVRVRDRVRVRVSNANHRCSELVARLGLARVR